MHEYSYDLNGDLVGHSVDGVSASTYTWDADRRRSTANGRPATYNDAGELIDFDSTAIVYDANGYLADDGTWSYDYSIRGELLRATRNSDGREITYDWDGARRLISRTADNETIFIRYNDPFAPYRITSIEEPNGLLVQPIYDDAGRLIELTRGITTYAVSTDPAGSPRAYVTSNGTIVKRIERGPFGELIS